MPKVSVVIPTYNGSKYLVQTIESVLNQSYNDYEILVIDDGSKEDIELLLTPYRKRLSYTRIANSGPAAARNAGIRLSSGEFVALLDHDDIWMPENLHEKMKLLLNNTNYAMVYSYPTLIDSDGIVIPQEPPSLFPSGSVFEDFLIRNRITTFSCTLIRKDIFDTVGFLDERHEITCCDDYDLWLRIADVSHIEFSSDQNVCYRIHCNNLINNHDMSINSHMTVYRKALKESKSLSKLSRSRLSHIVKKHVHEKYQQYAYKFYYDNANYKKTRQLLGLCILMKPFILKDWRYFLLCSLPLAFVEKLRLVKRQLALDPNNTNSK